MKKLLFSALFFSAIAWLWIGHMIAADGNLANQNGTTVAGAANMTNSVLFTTAITNSGNIQSATLNTTGIINSGARITSGADIVSTSNLRLGGGGLLTWSGTPGTLTSSGSALVVDTNIISYARVTATNGFASFASDAGVALAATGITNSLGKNAMAYVTATAIAFTIKDAASTTLYTSPVLTATISVQLHPGWSVNAASGLSGTLLPE